jgi:CrcB protein
MQSHDSTGRRKISMMNWISLFSIGVGAMLGAWLRWVLGLWLNPLFPTMPLGTLAANLLGGYLVGAAVTLFHLNADFSPEFRLFFITGVLGALTTFSTFSAEVVALIQRAEYGWAAGTASLHLLGSLVMTGLGILTINKLAQ